MRKRWGLSVLAILVALALGLALPVPAQAMTPRLITGPYVSGWFGYWEPDSAVQELVDKGTSTVPEVNIFWATFTGPDRPLCAYAYNAEGACYDNPDSPWIDPRIAEQRRMMQAAGIPVLGSIVDGSAAGALSAYLGTDATREAYAAQIVEWATKAGFDGVDLDWEKFAFADDPDTWATTKPRWVAFIRTLSGKLHARDLVLSATVPAGSYPFRSDGSPNPGTGYWVYAWDEIIDRVDRLRIMAYDYSYSSPGPLGPYPWAEEVVASAIAQVAATAPAHRRKIWLGVPQYSRNWLRKNADGSYVTKPGCPSSWKPTGGSMMSQSLARALEIAAREQLTPTWDATYAEYTFRYWIDTAGTAGGSAVTCTAEREVWFEDTRSAQLKAGIVSSRGIGGLAIWEFGFVLDGFYSRMARKIAPPLEVRASFDDRIRRGESTKVAGRVLRGDKAVAGARVTVTWISSAGKTRALGATRTNAEGRYAVTVAPTRSGTLRITATSEGQKAVVTRPITVRP